MIISKISTRLNKLTPGMTFRKYVKNVLYHGEDCGYIYAAGKKKYVLTPALEKLAHKLDINDFDLNRPRQITPQEFKRFRQLLKPFIKNEKGFKKLKINENLYYSPSPASILVWKKDTPIVTIIKKLSSPTTDIIYHWLPFLRQIIRNSPYK